jgi:endonuclease/exonuclease/phosphatase family metal-dependent hydrolase
LNRRDFLRLSSIAAGGLLTTNATSYAHSSIVAKRTGPELRTITYNILACRGYPRTPENEAILDAASQQIPERIGLELALADPDIVTFQESPPEDVVARIANTLDMNYVYLPGGFPGAVLSRHPITEHANCPIAGGAPRPEDLFTRHWGQAVIDVNGSPLKLYSAHLHPSKAATREKEVTEILRVMQDDLDAGTPFLFQGDLNHKPDSSEYGRWQAAGLVDTFAMAGEGVEFTIPATTPRSRIDYVWAHGSLAQRIKANHVLFHGAFRVVPDDPLSFALSDHLPVLAVFDVKDGI